VAITCAAPASISYVRFAELRVSAMDVAPAWLAIWRRQSDAAGSRGHEDEIAFVHLGIFDERAVRSHEAHPDRRGLGGRKRFRVLHDGVVRHEDDLAVGVVLVH
jgi:hypothetical protein